MKITVKAVKHFVYANKRFFLRENYICSPNNKEILVELITSEGKKLDIMKGYVVAYSDEVWVRK